MHGMRRIGALVLSSLTVVVVASPAAVATGAASPISRLPTSQGTGQVVVGTADGVLRGSVATTSTTSWASAMPSPRRATCAGCRPDR
jgi:hypothetical protein